MKTKNAQTYGTPSIGCYLDQSYRNSDSHNAAVIRLAMEYGFSPDRETLNLLAREENDCLSESGRSDSEMLCYCADEAESWLNEQETRPFLYWANDGDASAFGLWPNVEGAREDCGFVSHSDRNHTEECDPDDAAYPAADFRGEWLHVSDHGNATLYVREDCAMRPDGAGMTNFQDREVWSVV